MTAVMIIIAIDVSASDAKSKAFELRKEDRAPNQVTSDFGKAFIGQIKTEVCTEKLAQSIYGVKFTEEELLRKFKSEANNIVELFSQLMDQEFSGRVQCSETAYGMANEIIQHGSCFAVVAAKLYKLDNLDKNSSYIFEKNRFDRMIENKEKIDQFNMPLSDSNSCVHQGKVTYLALIKQKAKESVSLARVFKQQLK